MVALGDLKETIVGEKGSTYVSHIAYVPAGEATLTMTSDNTTLQIEKITIEYGVTSPIIQKISGDYGKTATYKADENTYYAIALIKADEATANSELSLNYKGTALEGTATKTVYDKVSIGSIEYTADKFGGNAGEYLYAVEIKNDGTDDSTTLADRVKAIGRTLVSATPAE